MIWLVLIGVVLFFLIFRPYFVRFDTLCAFTGTLGAGKTWCLVFFGKIQLRLARLKRNIYNIFHPRHRKPKPLLYSNIPVRVSRREWSTRLTVEHLLLQERQVEGSITLIDEIDFIANQFEFKNINVVRKSDKGGALDEYFRLYRHYVGGKLLCTAQSSDNINFAIRRRMNSVYNLSNCRFWGVPFGPKFLFTVKCRHISVSEDIKTIEVGQREDEYDTIYGLVPPLRAYASRVFRHRYDTVPEGERVKWQQYYTNINQNLPEVKIDAKVDSEELKIKNKKGR